MSSSSVVTGKSRPVFSGEAVKVYSSAPTNSETIGTVTVNVPSGFTHFILHPEVNELKNQAGKIGANGIILGDPTTKLFVGYTHSAVAIFVP
jgi:hypothetical protein